MLASTRALALDGSRASTADSITDSLHEAEEGQTVTISSVFMCVQPDSTTLFGVPFPLPTPQGRWDRQLRDMPETEIRGLRPATLRTKGTFGKPIQEGVPGLQRGPKAKLMSSLLRQAFAIH